MPNQTDAELANTTHQIPSRLHALVQSFRRLFIRGAHTQPACAWSARFLDSLERGSMAYDRAQLAVDLCNDISAITARRNRLHKQRDDITKALQDTEAFTQLSDADASTLNRLIAQYDSAAKDKDALARRIAGFSDTITSIAGIEDEAHAALPEICGAEEKQHIFCRDLNHLRDEKAALERERESLLLARSFAQKFSLLVIIAVSIIGLGLGTLSVLTNISTITPIAILVAFLIVSLLGMRGMQWYARRTLGLNRAKQLRAIELINKKNAVLLHHTTFLNYEYKKFNVRNAEMLREHLRDHESYQQLLRRSDSMRSIMKQAAAELDYFLHTHRLPSASPETIIETGNADDRRKRHAQLAAEKRLIASQIVTLDKGLADIQKRLDTLKAIDTPEGGVVEDIIIASLNLSENNETPQ